MGPFSNELNELLVSTYREIGRIEELVLQSLSDDTLSIAELHMLDVVGREGCTVTEIAQNMAISMPSATIAVKKLEKKGYVTKEKDPDDARRVCIRLTLLGRKAEAAHRWFHRQMVNNVEKTVTQDEQELLLRVIRSLEEFFRKKSQELLAAFPLDMSESGEGQESDQE